MTCLPNSAVLRVKLLVEVLKQVLWQVCNDDIELNKI